MIYSKITIESKRIRQYDIYSRELVGLLFVQPYCKISFFLVDSGVASRNTASKLSQPFGGIRHPCVKKSGNETLS
jgi:hypothetical protein